MLIKGKLTLNGKTHHAVLMSLPPVVAVEAERVEADLRVYDDKYDSIPLVIHQSDFDALFRDLDNAMVELVHRRLLTILPDVEKTIPAFFEVTQ